jgi:antitoxin PrlF
MRAEEPGVTTATVTSKGQITIPAAVRDALGVEAGDRIEFVEVAAGCYEVVAATASVSAMKGMFGKSRQSVSIDEEVVMQTPPSAVLADQVKSLDWRARAAVHKGAVPPQVLAGVRGKIKALLGLSR